MSGRAPSWWYGRGGAVALLLSPAALSWMAAGALRSAFTRPYRSALPVICIGNPTAGGGGKTPAAIAIARLLVAMGEKPVFLSRGHGGSLLGPHPVDPKTDTAAQVGDEPLLLARIAPTIVSARRDAGARMAETLDASVIVMDDGFQNPQLAKDLSILAVDREAGVGNGWVIPSGPLRAPLGGQLDKAGALLLTGDGKGGGALARQAEARGLRVIEGQLVPAAKSPVLKGKRVLAFAGIARPRKFFDSLSKSGAKLAEGVDFPDHHVFTKADCERLLAAARHHKAKLVTTEKDHVRIADAALARAAVAVPVVLKFSNEKAVRAMLKAALDRFREPAGRTVSRRS